MRKKEEIEERIKGLVKDQAERKKKLSGVSYGEMKLENYEALELRYFIIKDTLKWVLGED